MEQAGRGRRLWPRIDDPQERRARALLVALLVVLLAYLAFGGNPWNDGIAKRIRDGAPVRSVDYAITYGWAMAAVNAALVGVLLATRRRWLTGETLEQARFAAPRAAPRWFAPAVVGAVVATALLAAPRLSHSLWGDEEWTVRRAIDGAYYREASGEVRYHPVGWRETFFDYRKPSNHIGFTVPARASLELWRALARPELHFVSEPAVRMPAFLAGLGAVAATALLLRRLGFAGAGVVAAWLLALHPWHLRYASEARGYALLVLLVPLAMLALLRALERGSWGRWAAFALALFWMMWTWPPAAFAVATLAAVAVYGIWRAWRATGETSGAWRFAVTGLVAGLVWLQLMLGSLVQLGTYMERAMLPMNARWLRNLGAHFLAGTGWAPDHPFYVDVVELAAANPVLFWGFVSAAVGLAVVGTLRLLLGGFARAATATVLLLPGPLLVAYSWRSEAFLNHWYLLFALPGAVMLVAVGLETGLRPLAGRRSTRAVAALLAVTLVTAFAGVTQPVRAALRAGSLQPMRESVELTRPTLDPDAPENRRITTASFQRAPTYYDPLVIELASVRELRDLMRAADERGTPLFVNYGRPELAERRTPELVGLVHDPALFERVAELRGFEPRGLRYVYRYKGAAGPRTGAAR